MNTTVIICLLVIGGIVGFGIGAIPYEIQKEIEKTDDKDEFYRYSYIDQKSCIEKYEAMYNLKSNECVSKEPIIITQEYEGSLTIEPICEPTVMGNLIIKENCDVFLKWMDTQQLVDFIKENPDALTDEEQDILLSKAVANNFPDQIDYEIENKAGVIMWRLADEGLY